jgi:hypothetical protein
MWCLTTRTGLFNTSFEAVASNFVNVSYWLYKAVKPGIHASGRSSKWKPVLSLSLLFAGFKGEAKSQTVTDFPEFVIPLRTKPYVHIYYFPQ